MEENATAIQMKKIIVTQTIVQNLANGQNGGNGVLVPNHVVAERGFEREIRKLKKNMADHVMVLSARNQLAIRVYALNRVNGVNGVSGKNVQKPVAKV